MNENENIFNVEYDLLPPSGWDVIKLRHIFRFGKGLSITKENLTEDGIPVISYGQIHSKANKGTGLNDSLIRFVPEEYLRHGKSALVHRDDIVFADTSEDYAGIGNCVLIDRDCTMFAGYHAIVAHPKKQNFFSKYLAYQFLTDIWRTQIRAQVMGVKVFSVSQALLGRTSVLLPPIEEQKAIASTLDEECAKIDSIISDLEQQLSVLNQYRESVITETVTKGLNRKGDYYDSGIGWIGEIPKGWDVIKLRYLGWLQNGISKDADSFGSGYPFVSYGDVYNNRIVPEMVVGLVESSAQDRRQFSVKYGDVFFTRTSETIEEIGIASTCLHTVENATFAGFLIRFRPTTGSLYPGFSKYYFRAELLRRYFVKEMMIVTRASLGQNLLKNLPVLVPPIEEQKAIARYLDEKCNEIDEIVAVKEQQLANIKVCRRAMIYEYVTGKKRVKGAATYGN